MIKGQAKILAQGIYEATRGKNQAAIDKLVNNFFHYLREHRLRHLLPDILTELDNLNCQENNIISVNIRSRVKLDEQMIADISKLVGAKTKKQAKIKTEIDDSLVGGALVRYGDKLIDISFKKQLSSLAKKLSS